MRDEPYARGTTLVASPRADRSTMIGNGDPPAQPQIGADVDRRHAAAGDRRIDAVAAFQYAAEQRIVGGTHGR